MNEFADNPLTHAAFLYAKAAHERVGQKRKFGPVQRDYIVHPVQTAEYQQQTIHNTPADIATALLHDTLEDTLREGQTVQDGAEELAFALGAAGVEPADIAAVVIGVLEVTDVAVPTDGNRAARMAINCAHAGKAAPPRQTTKLCDIKSNMPSIVKYNPGFARKWVAEKANVVKLLTQGDPKMLAEVRDMIARYNKGLFNADNYHIV